MRIVKFVFIISIPIMLIGLFLADVCGLTQLGLNIFMIGGLLLAVVITLSVIFSILLTPRNYWDD